MITSPIFDSFGDRTLAAIVFTDVVNYSARMSVDEEHTLRLVQRDLQVMSEDCQKHGGQVLKFTGDGLLMYFHSAVQAVACALESQKSIAEKAKTLGDRDILWHRIGIHLGDVFLSKTDVMGDGVNIAARLQSEAKPGGICMSRTVYDVVKRCLTLKATYLGPRDLKNINEAVHVYQILMAAITDEESISTLLEKQDPNSALEDTESGDLAQNIEYLIDTSEIHESGVIHDKDESSNSNVEAELSSSSNLDQKTSFESEHSEYFDMFPAEVHSQLETIIISILGPIGSLILNQSIKDTLSPLDAVDRMVLSIPANEQEHFYKFATKLVTQIAPISKGELSHSSSEESELRSEDTDPSLQRTPLESSNDRNESTCTEDTFMISEFQRTELCNVLAEHLGPIATLTLKRAIESTKSSQDFISYLLNLIPEDCHTSFREFALSLLSQDKTTEISSTNSTLSSSQGSTREELQFDSIERAFEDPSFLKFCEEELAKHIGPIATILIQRFLSEPTFTKDYSSFMDSLAAYINNPDAMIAFQKSLKKWTKS